MDSQRRVSLVRVEQTKRLRKAFLICRAELRERFDEVRCEQQGAVAVDGLATPLDASTRAKELGFRHLEDPTGFYLGEGALQRRQSLRRVCPAILVRNNVSGLQADAAVLHLHFKLSPFTDTQLPANVDRQSQTPLLVDGDNVPCHMQSLSDEVSLRQTSADMIEERAEIGPERRHHSIRPPPVRPRP